ncbi:MAG: S41 family peptidase, partial [Candidatus Marinimicrobia bacterium]|nr:S41 family peptidase [Candidatus Neomarinimicrobiota bacterium]
VLLRDAVALVDAMVPPGRDIVSTKGRTKKSIRNYTSEKTPVLDENIPLMILVNGGSASASEIVAGAIQDLDRGVIIGSETFGKGLVQSIFPLSRNTSIKMTTAKYYMPSGRLIQKEDYRDGDVFTDGDNNRDSLYTTSNGREVHGAGGITPDVEVKPAPLGPLTRRLWSGGHFFSFAAANQKNYDLTLPLVVTDEMISRFRDFIAKQEIEVTLPGEKQMKSFEQIVDSLDNFAGSVDLSELKAHFADSKENIFDDEIVSIRRGLLLEFSAVSGGLPARIRASLRDDPVYKQALELLADPLAYEALLSPPDGATQLGSRQ